MCEVCVYVRCVCVRCVLVCTSVKSNSVSLGGGVYTEYIV